ncbi:MAG: hypothetical protein M3186_01675 [Actinomycetota bacterium]|nr:hypothetical protein [Actinomycetota bacterium]
MAWQTPRRPQYWNAPFGAVLTYDQLHASEDPVAGGVAFLQRGIDLLCS